MIVIDNVSFSYLNAPTPVFSDLSLFIAARTWVSITGPDGSGKTTLAKLIKGLYKPERGTITLHGPADDADVFVAYVGGDPSDSLVGTSVEEEVAFGLENMQVPPADMRKRVEQALAWTGLAGMEQRLTHSLSGGEQQKLALAAMLALHARVLILDEACSMLDKPIRRVIRNLVKTLMSRFALTVIEITQSMEDAAEAERVVFLSKQGIDFDGTPAAFVGSKAGRDWVRKGSGLAALQGALTGRGLGVAPGGEPFGIASKIADMIKR